ncbi:hypothetical protein CcCBS67573_g00867 [Chytriomyces confervae]|uniref:Mannosyltransferase n=1 Tax=Chytriomyces confervae TaxID=246404 RepID=A0A507FQG2_9FUNG|nr:hypothetical protein HDU80_002654 [Chytriomyces hyalinus]TPX77825.1 hypothetical protein CcCBS67573_g00867 [Chytriomyces confervae]
MPQNYERTPSTTNRNTHHTGETGATPLLEERAKRRRQPAMKLQLFTRRIRRIFEVLVMIGTVVLILYLGQANSAAKKSVGAEGARMRKKWQRLYKEGKLDVEPLNKNMVKGSRGIVLMGTSSTVNLAVTTTILLRDTGCVLPVEFAYLPNEVTEQDLQILRSNNITTRNYFTPEIDSYNWNSEHLRLGVLKPLAVITSPFQEILFLDPDMIPLRDPTFLFSTPQFKETGALFWPDFPATAQGNPIWQIMGQEYEFEREFETGAIVLDKARVSLGLGLAWHLCQNAAFYFQFMWGDKDAFRWGFRGAQIPYHLNPNYLMSVGVVVSETMPFGNVSLVETKDGLVPAEGKYCGQGMVQMDFDAGVKASADFQPSPLFMHANGIKKFYREDIPPFQVAQVYTGLPKGQTLNSLRVGKYHWIGELYGQNHCGMLEPQAGLKVSYLEASQNQIKDFAKMFPGVNEKYMHARKTASATLKTPDISSTVESQTSLGATKPVKPDPPESQPLNQEELEFQSKWDAYAQSKEFQLEFDEDPEAKHVIRGSKGVLMMGTSATVDLALMAAEFLRGLGCTLEIEFAYLKSEVTQSDLDKLKANNITTRNYDSPKLPLSNWSREELRLGATKPFALLSSPFQHTLFMDPDVYPLQDPTQLFSSVQYKQTGALFWPDFPSTPRTNKIWTLLRVPFVFEREFESGLMLLDKARIWRGLKFAARLCSDARFTNTFLWGDKDTFRFGMKVAGLSYSLNRNYLTSLGVIVDKQRPLGNVSLTTKEDAIPPGAEYCGQSMLQMTFDNSESDTLDTPQPLWIHANGIRSNYKDSIPPFQVAQTYALPSDFKNVDATRVGKYHWIGRAQEQDHCGRMEDQAPLTIVNYDFAKRYPGVNERYIQVRRKVFGLKGA